MDDVQLRRLATECGLSELGAQARWNSWAQLLGLKGDGPSAQPCPRGDLARDHGVSHQFIIDCDRAMHFDMCVSWSDARRSENSRNLAWLLHTAFSTSHPKLSSAYYFQGCHEIASVVMLQSQASAPCLARQAAVLQALLQTRLQGFAAPTMDTASRSLDAVSRLLEIIDPRLQRAVAGSELALLSWVICLGAHDLRCWANVTRLFDFYIAGHPLLPIYTAASLLHLHRDFVLAEAAKADAVLFVTLRELPSRLRGEQRPPSAKSSGAGATGSASRDGSATGDSPAATTASGGSSGAVPAASAAASSTSRSRASLVASQAAARRQESLQEVIARGSAGSITIEQVVALASGLCRALPPALLLCAGPSDILLRMGRDWPSALRDSHQDAPWACLAHEAITNTIKPLTQSAVTEALASGTQPLIEKGTSSGGATGVSGGRNPSSNREQHGADVSKRKERSRQQLWLSTLLLGLAGAAVVFSMLVKAPPHPWVTSGGQGLLAKAFGFLTSIGRCAGEMLQFPMTPMKANDFDNT